MIAKVQYHVNILGSQNVHCSLYTLNMVQKIAWWWLIRVETCRCDSVIKCCVWLKFVYSLTIYFCDFAIHMSESCQLIAIYYYYYYYPCYHLYARYVQLYTSNKPCFYGTQCCSCSVSTVCAARYLISTVKYVLCFYISTSCSVCPVANVAVFCISLISCFTGMLLSYYLINS